MRPLHSVVSLTLYGLIMHKCTLTALRVTTNRDTSSYDWSGDVTLARNGMSDYQFNHFAAADNFWRNTPECREENTERVRPLVQTLRAISDAQSIMMAPILLTGVGALR